MSCEEIDSLLKQVQGVLALCEFHYCEFGYCGFSKLLQGISHWTGLYELALTDRNMQVKSCLNIALEFWDWEFLVYILGFQKSNISWPHYIYMPAEKRTSILSASDLVLLLLIASAVWEYKIFTSDAISFRCSFACVLSFSICAHFSL